MHLILEVCTLQYGDFFDLLTFSVFQGPTPSPNLPLSQPAQGHPQNPGQIAAPAPQAR
jgi:hypothetical protein